MPLLIIKSERKTDERGEENSIAFSLSSSLPSLAQKEFENEHAWIDKTKTKVGYEIPMTRYFYEYQAPESADEILSRIISLEDEIAVSLKTLLHKGE